MRGFYIEGENKTYNKSQFYFIVKNMGLLPKGQRGVYTLPTFHVMSVEEILSLHENFRYSRGLSNRDPNQRVTAFGETKTVGEWQVQLKEINEIYKKRHGV